MQEMNIYEIEKNAEGHWQLSINSKQSICPLAGAFPSHSPLGSFLGFTRLACTTGCPLAELDREPAGDLKYAVHCGGSKRTLSVTEKMAPDANKMTLNDNKSSSDANSGTVINMNQE